jgi:hypothetical protein
MSLEDFNSILHPVYKTYDGPITVIKWFWQENATCCLSSYTLLGFSDWTFTRENIGKHFDTKLGCITCITSAFSNNSNVRYFSPPLSEKPLNRP